MYPHSPFLLLLPLFLCYLTPSHASAPIPPNITRYFEVTHPLPTDHQIASYSLTYPLLFNGTVRTYAVSGEYTPPVNCSAPWTAVVVEFAASCSGKQPKRIVAVWIGGVEILRTSTVETKDHGIFWKVRKEVTRYASVLSRSNSTVSIVLENMANDALSGNYRANVTGNFHVNVTLFFYGGVIPSVKKGDGENGFKFSRKLGVLGEESGGLGFVGKKSAEREGKIDFPWKDNSQSDLLVEKMIGGKGGEKEEEEMEMEFEWKEKTQFEILGEEEENVGFLYEESASLMDREENSKSGNEELSMDKKTLRLQSEDFEMGVKRVKSIPLYQDPADLIIPISSKIGNPWFRIENGSDIRSKDFKIPNNTYRAVLEIYVSSHAEDEFWYANPPNSFIQIRNQSNGLVNGAFRQVYALVDCLYVGSTVPFPVVFSGGIDPLFWDPVVAIGAFDLPSYDIDITPFLGNLLDGKLHSLTLGVSDASSFWLVDANLHLWLDHKSPHVTAKLVTYRAPELSISRKYKFGDEGEFKIKVERETHFVGWVNSSIGNLTTNIEYELEFENQIKIKNDGKFKEVEQKIEEETEINVEAFSKLLLAKAEYENEYPLKIKIETEAKENNANSTKTTFSHEMKQKSSVVLPSGQFFSSLENSQESEGRLLVQDKMVLSAVANTEQKYSYKDGKGCFIRNVVTSDGLLLEDNLSNICLTEDV